MESREFGKRTLDTILNQPENEAFKEEVEQMKGAFQMRREGAHLIDDQKIDELCERGERLAIRPEELRKYITG